MAFDYRLSNGPLCYTQFHVATLNLPDNCKLDTQNVDKCLEQPPTESGDYSKVEEFLINYKNKKKREENKLLRKAESKEEKVEMSSKPRLRSQTSIEDEEKRLKDELLATMMDPTPEPEMKVTPSVNLEDEFQTKLDKIQQMIDITGVNESEAGFYLESCAWDVTAAQSMWEMMK